MKHCPHCQTDDLTTLDDLGAQALACKTCHGLWLEKSELETISAELPSRGWFDIALWEKEELLSATASALACPSDGKNLVNIKWDESIDAYMCAECGGLWLPASEYRKLPALFASEADTTMMADHGELLSHQLMLFIEGKKTAGEEVSDIKDLLKFLEYRFAARHPALTELIERLPFAS